MLKQHPRNTPIRNTRQLCVVSAEEMAAVAEKLGMERIDPPGSALRSWSRGSPISPTCRRPAACRGPIGATLVVDMLNEPCQEPAVTMTRATGGQGKAFKAAAEGKRGVTAWVEREGTLRLGDSLRLHIPRQRAWTGTAAALVKG